MFELDPYDGDLAFVPAWSSVNLQDSNALEDLLPIIAHLNFGDFAGHVHARGATAGAQVRRDHGYAALRRIPAPGLRDR